MQNETLEDLRHWEQRGWGPSLTLHYQGYMMSKHTSLSHFVPYFLLFGRHPIPPSSIATQMD